jgi:threonine synthase
MKAIKFYSTNLKSEHIGFGKALLKGIAPDGGLYMPDRIPSFSQEEFAEMKDKPYHEIAKMVLHKFLSAEMGTDELGVLTKSGYNFKVPLEQVYGNKYVMRLDQGPTASFKDFAACMMGQLMQYYLAKENKKLLILTATSGDTGSAIANAFYGLENIKVVVLFPETEVTDRQRKQMTTLQKNIQIIALDGKFDDCQALVKQAFADKDLDYLNLSSANSINIGRLLPQSVYYVYAWLKLANISENESVVFSVPSGNFGDLMGGLIAKNLGVPVSKFVVSTNENDEFPEYLRSGHYKTISPSKNCLSSAMNVGHPSNMSRLVALYDGNMDENGVVHKNPDMKRMSEDMYAVSITDSKTKNTIAEAWKNHHLLLEPHGSVAWAGLMRYLKNNNVEDVENQLCVSLETAHPAKFPEQIKELLSIDPDLPQCLKGLDEKKEYFVKMKNEYIDFKVFLTENYN